MTHTELRAARMQLGLTRPQLAALTETARSSVQRWEMPPDRATARRAPPRAERLIRAYLDGWRPADWPAKTKQKETT